MEIYIVVGIHDVNNIVWDEDEEPNVEYCFNIIDVFDYFERAIRCDEENYCGYDRIKIIKKNLIVS